MNSWLATLALAATLSTGHGLRADQPACLPLEKIDQWRVHDRITLIVQSEGRDIGRVEVVESMAGSSPLYLAHKIWFEARDGRLCGERDVVVADGRRRYIRRVIPLNEQAVE